LRILPSKIPSLDGLRTVSIALVILSHLAIRSTLGGPVRNFFVDFAKNGKYGVSVFFVISGFLITTLLMREKEKFKRVDLGAFYLRRAFRILPAFLLYMLTVLLLTGLGVIFVDRRSFLWAVTLVSDYANVNWYVGHTWSLSVEEQFYFLWPLLFAFCSRRTLVVIASLVIVLDPLLRVLTWYAFPLQRMSIRYMFHARADILMFGCVAALLFDLPQFQMWLEKLIQWKAPMLALLVFLFFPQLQQLAGASHHTEFFLITVGFTIQGVAITLLMLYAIVRATSGAGRLLNSHLLTYVGVRSYSLYLWQQLFLGYRAYSAPRLALGLCAAVLAAFLSYSLVEQPMLRLKRSLGAAQKPPKDALVLDTDPA